MIWLLLAMVCDIPLAVRGGVCTPVHSVASFPYISISSSSVITHCRCSYVLDLNHHPTGVGRGFTVKGDEKREGSSARGSSVVIICCSII